MNLDLRIPMGMMFSMMGAVLFAFGLATRTRPELYTKFFGINANLWWGAAMLIFGIVVIGLGRRGQGRIELEKARKTGQAETGQKKPGPRRPPKR